MGATQQTLLMIRGEFSPLDVAGCALWLDGDDADTITLVSGKVSEWADKSGNGRNVAMTTAAARPSTSTINALVCLSFTGSQWLVNPSAALLRSVSGWSCFVVGEISEFNTFQPTTAAIYVSATNQDTARMQVGNTTSTQHLWGGGRRQSADAFQTIEASNTIAVNTPFLLTVIGDYTNTDGTLWKDGTQEASNTTWADAGNTQADGGIVSIGARGPTELTANDLWRGKIAEVIVYSTALGASDRETVEAYLMDKWGL